MASTNLPSMYIWYGVTSDFRVLPRAVAVLVIVPSGPALAGVSGSMGSPANLSPRHEASHPKRQRRGHAPGTSVPSSSVLRATRPRLQAATVSRDGRIRTFGSSARAVSSRTCHGMPSRASRSRNGSGSNSSGERTPGPAQRPSWISRAAMTGGMPGLIRRRLHAELGVDGLVVGDVVDVERPRLAVLAARAPACRRRSCPACAPPGPSDRAAARPPRPAARPSVAHADAVLAREPEPLHDPQGLDGHVVHAQLEVHQPRRGEEPRAASATPRGPRSSS